MHDPSAALFTNEISAIWFINSRHFRPARRSRRFYEIVAVNSKTVQLVNIRLNEGTCVNCRPLCANSF